ncbi:tRNA pseudouridine(55) synthase TruB [Luteimonas pelagia]
MNLRSKRTPWRPLDGIVLLDKPSGLSSNDALQRARRLLRAAKGGHTGALDPLATGLLPLCFGEATKLAGLLLGARKAYEAEARLGATTDTDDADGTILRERAVPPLEADAVRAALGPLTGRIRQRAPVYSALKQGGEPLYAKARRGEAIDAPVREVDVEALELLALDGDRLRLRIECGSGTYVRSLVRDLGEALGCGAHVTALRRLWVEPFMVPDMVTLDALESLAGQGDEAFASVLQPVEAGLAGFPPVHVDAEAARRLAQGQALREEALAGRGETVALFDGTGRALGVGRRDPDGLRPQRLFSWAAALGQPGTA